MSVAVLSILMLSDAQSNTSQNFSVRGLVFTGTGKLGDFAWMITQPEYQDALFIFNDNEDQFEAHRTSPESRTGPGCTHGGGTAVIRPFQCLSPPRAVGIPTGTDQGYDRLSSHVKQLIDKATSQICKIILDQGYQRIFYSAQNEQGDLGHGIFNPSEDVKTYIVKNLRDLPTTCTR